MNNYQKVMGIHWQAMAFFYFFIFFNSVKTVYTALVDLSADMHWSSGLMLCQLAPYSNYK